MRWVLIDGQQRLTTLTLLLLAPPNQHCRVGLDGPTVKRIEAYFLKNVQKDGVRQWKLKFRHHDDAALRALLDGAYLPETVSEPGICVPWSTG